VSIRLAKVYAVSNYPGGLDLLRPRKQVDEQNASECSNEVKEA
jgi:hypothetical protein